MTEMWDISRNMDPLDAQNHAEKARRAIQVTTLNKSNNLFSESELVDAVRGACGQDVADVVEGNIVALRVLFKNWLAQR